MYNIKASTLFKLYIAEYIDVVILKHLFQRWFRRSHLFPKQISFFNEYFYLSIVGMQSYIGYTSFRYTI